MERHYARRLSRIKARMSTVQDRLAALEREYTKINREMTDKHYEYESRIQKICKHEKYPVRKRENMRDDASFKYWVECSVCGIDLRYE